MLTDRQIEALVATEVMGQRRVGGCGLGDEFCPGTYVPSTYWPCLPRYLTDLTAAFEVIEKVAAGGILFMGQWGAALGRDDCFAEHYGEPTWQSAWKACVLEYLKAKGVDVEQ